MLEGRHFGLIRGAFTGSVALSIALLLGRLSGLWREIELAAVFGVSREADIAVLLLTLPDLLVGILLAGGLSAALVPQFRILDSRTSRALFRRAAIIVCGAFAVAALLIFFWPEALFALLAPGLPQPETMITSIALACICLSIPLTAISGVTTAYLNAHDRFFGAGLGTLIFNLGILAALWARTPGANMLTLLGIGVLVGAAVRWIIQVSLVPQSADGAVRPEGMIDPRFGKAFAAGLAATSILLLVPLLIRAFASVLGAGTIAAFNYAQKIIELPVGILITTVSTVALTRLSGLHGEGRDEDAKAAAQASLRRSLVVAAAVLVLGSVFMNSFVSLVFGRGAMDVEAVGKVTDLAIIALIGVPFVAISSMAAASLNARLMTAAVFRINLISLFVVPIIALPALALRSEWGLMLAVVAFQSISALWLSHRAAFRLFGGDGIVSGPMVRALAIGTVVAAGVIALDQLAQLASDVARLALAGVGFALAVLLPLRILK